LCGIPSSAILPAMSTESTDDREVSIYADGAAMPNPGAGGYGVILIRNGQRHQRRQELSGGAGLSA
jgi:ribonuclease HI